MAEEIRRRERKDDASLPKKLTLIFVKSNLALQPETGQVWGPLLRYWWICSFSKE